MFLSHAGEQKKVFVDFLYSVLTEEGISVFMDEPSLTPGTSESWQSIVEALRSAAVGVPKTLVFIGLLNTPALCFCTAQAVQCNFAVHSCFDRYYSLPASKYQSVFGCRAVVVVLSPEFVRKRCPMEELEILLARQRAEPGSVRVLPVWYGITYQQCCDLEAVYELEENWVGGEPKPAPNVLAHWAGTVRELLKTTAVRDDQVEPHTFMSALYLCAHCNSKLTSTVLRTGGESCASVLLLGPQFCGYIGRMAFSVRALVVQHLKEAKLLPAHFVPRDQLEISMQLHRIAQPLLGREAEVQQILDSLMEHHAAIIWGGPGEGKSSIAMEAGCRLWDAEKCLGRLLLY